MRPFRRSSMLVAVVFVFSLLPVLPAQPTASAAPVSAPAAQVDAQVTPPPPVVETVQPVTYPQLPGLALDVEAGPGVLTLGDTATLTLTLINRAPHAATNVTLDLPLPDGTAPVPGPGLQGQSWRWTAATLAGGATLTQTATVRLVRMPQGAALLARPEATATGLAEPARAVGGAVVRDRVPPPATAAFTPGQAATLQSADGRITVHVPANGAPQDLTLRHGVAPLPGEPPVPPQVRRARDWDAFYLNATTAQGQQVHQFNQPVTIKARYTPEQLLALGIAEADLTVQWYDEDAQTWVAVPTRIDAATDTAIATVDHFSTFALSDGSSPSAKYIPSLQGFQVGLYTGAASYSMPLEVPAGPGGLKPSLDLSYSSATSDGPGGTRENWQASWVGKGWNLDPGGSVALNKSLAGNGWNHYTFVFGGRSFDVVKGQRLSGTTEYGSTDPTLWTWHASDENFTKVRAENAGSGNIRWKAWTKDGTRYDFTTPLTTTDSETNYVYKWLLTQVTDVHGNALVYDYGIHEYSGRQPAAYVSAIRWAFDGATPGTGTARYKVEFLVAERWTSPTESVDLDWQAGCGSCNNTYWKPYTVHERYRLNNIRVLSMPPGETSYQLVRQYNLSYATSANSVKADHVNGQRVLTLTSVQQMGKDGSTVLPASTFTYVPAGTTGAHRLQRADNGQGGRVEYTYEKAWVTTPSGECSCLYDNYYRVSQLKRSDTAGKSYSASYLTTYSYTSPALNTAANAATIVYAQYPPSGNGNSVAFLARPEKREFRGHAQVTETQYSGATTSTTVLRVGKHWFYQGDNGCSPTVTDERISETDTCFQAMVKREGWKGREWKTEIAEGGATNPLQRIERVFTRMELPFWGSDASVSDSAGLSNNYKRAGLWRAFNYESQTVEIMLEGGTTSSDKTTTYAYDTGYQAGGVFYGNLGRIEERNQSGTLVRKTQRWYNTLNDDTNGRYIVDRMRAELVTDTDGNYVALTNLFYDGRTTAEGVVDKGNLTLARKYYDVPLQTSVTNLTLNSSDTSYTYDTYGNRVTETTYAGSGTRVYNGSTLSWSSPGNGSAATTTVTQYETTFKTFPIRVTSPTVNSVTLIEQAGYDYRMGTLTSVTDVNSNVTTAEYDVFGRMVKLIKPGDTAAIPTVQATYYDTEQPFKFIVAMREVSGQAGNRPIMRFYDGLGREVQSKQESGDGTQNIVVDTQYNALGNVTRESQARYVDETPATTFWTYTTPPTNGINWTTTTYDALSRPRVITQPDNTTLDHHYGIVDSLRYHDVVDPNRHRTQWRYDGLGRLANVQEISGDCANGYWTYPCAGTFTTGWSVYGVTTYGYSALDLLTRVQDQLGNVTTMTYDSLGRKKTMSDPDMGSWSYAYDVDGNLTSQTDAKNQTTTFAYDDLSRLTSKTTPDGWVSSYGYDGATSNGKGQRTSMSRSASSVQQSATSFYYDTRGRKTKEVYSVNGMTGTREIRWQYDAADRVTEISDPSMPPDEAIQYGYDAAWRPRSACGITVECYTTNAQYTALNQLTQTSRNNALMQYWTYSGPMQRLERVRIGTGGSGGMFDRSYTYDTGGNVKTITDSTVGQTQNFQYDHRDRLTRAYTSGTSGTTSTQSLDVTPEADTYISDSATTTNYGTATDLSVGGGTTKRTAYLRFNVTGLPAGAVITDARLVMVASNGSTEGGGTIRKYDPTTEQWSETTPTWSAPLAGSDASVDLSSVGAVTNGGTTTFTGLQRAVEGNGRVTFVIRSSHQDGVAYRSREYSTASQRPILRISYTTSTGPASYDQSYAYDAIGNLTSKAGVSLSYGANGNGTGAGPHQARSVGGVSYTYDANGNLTTRTGTSITWNVDNQPTGITNNGVTETYQYDADGERIKRVANGVTTVYLGGMYEEDLETGTKRMHYVFNGQVVAQRTTTTNSNTLIFLHNDHLGSVSVATSESGGLLNRQDFDPWGQVRNGGISRTTLNYTGQRKDGTGLLYYHARYYDPTLGRFLSADSVVPGSPSGSMDGVALKPLTVDFHEPGFAMQVSIENRQGFWFQNQDQVAPWGPENAQALNRYSYVQNNPLRYTDPTGHRTCSSCTGSVGYKTVIRLDYHEVERVADAVIDILADMAKGNDIVAAIRNVLGQACGVLCSIIETIGAIADLADNEKESLVAFVRELGHAANAYLRETSKYGIDGTDVAEFVITMGTHAPGYATDGWASFDMRIGDGYKKDLGYVADLNPRMISKFVKLVSTASQRPVTR